jgi:hypothetical protein
MQTAVGRTIDRQGKIGRIAAISILGGLHHQYVGLGFSLGTTIYEEESRASDYRRIATRVNAELNFFPDRTISSASFKIKRC